MSSTHALTHLLHRALQWRDTQLSLQENGLSLGLNTIIAAILCFAASALSSAGGVGGGAIYLPILNLVAGLDLKKASTFSAFMVTGGSVSNVLYNMCFKNAPNQGAKFEIDFDIALLSQPAMLLGVSLGVICNVVFPEWLVTLLFLAVLAYSTFKTCRAGAICWSAESDKLRRRSETFKLVVEEDGEKGVEQPLLGGVEEEMILGFPLVKMILLVLVWVAFFGVHALRGDKSGKNVLQISQCSASYWLITLFQIPLAMLFTVYILHRSRQTQDDMDQQDQMEKVTISKVAFPAAALLAGVLGGLFGIGGGLLINPVLLQMGVRPQIAAATCSLMVLFSSSMSSVQYLMLGMRNIDQALIFSFGCFIASLVGLVVIQRAINKSGRASLIIFSVSSVMALSTVTITCFGAIDVWRDYASGKYMGFKSPC